MAILTIDAIVNPWLLIPAAIMTALFFVIRMVYINAGRSFIRIESLGELKLTFVQNLLGSFSFFFFCKLRTNKLFHLSAYSPIFSHLNATLQGLPTVRALNAGKVLEKEFHEFQDHSTSCTYLFFCASHWFSLSMDIVCLLFIASVTYSFLILESSKSILLIS